MTPVEKIKEKLSIIDVVQNYVKLEKAGANMKGKCPFHNEKTPSFFVSPSRNTYYCFGCNAKGDIFSFVQEFEKVDFRGALKILAERAGVALTDYNPSETKEKDILLEVMESAASFFESNLSKNEAAKKYLLDRGLEEKTIKEWRIGYASDEWNSLHDFLKNPPASAERAGFKESDIEKVGLIKKGEKGSMYDRFRGRIMFPIFDPSGRVIAFSGRIFEGEQSAAKYINSPETPLFNKSEVLYGYHIAKNFIRTKKFSLLVEGQIDLLMCHQAGLNQAIATSGTALTEDQLLILKRSSANLMIAYDGDKAGINASKRAFAVALSLGFDVKVAPLPSGNDPADTIKKDPEEFKTILRNSKHIVDFSLENILQKGLEGRTLIKSVKENVLPYVNATASPSERAYFISSISDKIKIPESALYDELAMLEKDLAETSGVFKRSNDNTKTEPTKPGARKNFIQRKIAGLFFKADKKEHIVMESTFKRLFEDLPALTLPSIIFPYQNEKDTVVFEAEVDTLMDDEHQHQHQEKYFEELALSLKKEILQTELNIAKSDLRQAEKQKDTKKTNELLKLCRELTKRLSYLKI